MDQADELATLGDAELVARSRDGADEPYAELFRRHQPPALALARTLTDQAAADDVVAEAFEKLLLRIRGGAGPESAFRPYLLKTVRTVAVDTSRRTRRLVVADEPGAAGDVEPSGQDSLFDTVYERTTLARAFAALPERWQTFLWLSFVEGADRHEIATILGINPGGVSALGYRAREGLRRAYLDAHLVDAPTEECAEVWPLLSGAVRGGLSPAQRLRVDEHVDSCDRCRAALAELDSVNNRLGVLLAPLVLGAAGPAYLAATEHAHGAAAASTGTAATSGTTATDGTGTGSASAAGKASMSGVLKVGATGAALVASAAMIALVGMLALLTAPLGNERTAARLPGGTSLASSADGVSDSQRLGEEATSDPTATPGVSTGSSGAAAGDPTSETSASGTGAPTVVPSGTDGTPSSTELPTGTATTPSLPTPTFGPTTRPPTGGPTATASASPTRSGGPTTSPTTEQSPGDDPTPTTSSPSPSATGSEQPPPEVDARVGAIAFAARTESGPPVHVTIPVILTGGPADLQMDVSIVGLTSFRTTTGGGFGSWSCEATTPMAGNAKTAKLRCTLGDADPAGTLALGLDIGYVGNASLTAAVSVAPPTIDVAPSNDVASVELPPRKE